MHLLPIGANASTAAYALVNIADTALFIVAAERWAAIDI